MWNDRYSATSWRERCLFDPVSLTAISLAGTAASGAMSAASTIAGGDYAKEAGEYRAAQLRQNAGQAMASGQRKMFDTQLKTNMAIGTSRAIASGSGADATTGSPLANEGNLAQRGEYQALMDMFNGQAEATGYENQARAAEFEGDMKKKMSRLAALGTLAGTAGSMATRYGDFAYPSPTGRPGVRL